MPALLLESSKISASKICRKLAGPCELCSLGALRTQFCRKNPSVYSKEVLKQGIIFDEPRGAWGRDSSLIKSCVVGAWVERPTLHS